MYDVELYAPANTNTGICHFFLPTNEPLLIYDRVLAMTDSHTLASEIAGWSELAGFGEMYEDRSIIAEIVERI